MKNEGECMERKPGGREINPEPYLIPRPLLEKLTAIVADIVSTSSGTKISPRDLRVTPTKSTVILPSNVLDRISKRRTFHLSLELIDPQPTP
jgi:hypothetical protein